MGIAVAATEECTTASKRYSKSLFDFDADDFFRMKLLKISGLLAAVSVLAACTSTPLTSEAPQVSAAPVSAEGRQAATTRQAETPAQSSSRVAAVILPAHLDPRNPLAASRSVYFGFDAVTIEPSQFVVVERHGAYLKSQPELKVTIEGNTDEQGGAEYNLALGQRRAEAVVKVLATLGVKTSQMEATSWGREKPKALGHDEAAWAQNRRADIQYPSR